ncbi:MAG: recombinase family protein, partial [Chloroflexi bacterium]|nr:recombinase family protein [Chloroflexota bacterium]
TGIDNEVSITLPPRYPARPTNSKAPYGYQWNGTRFDPCPSGYPVAQRIWEMALEGVSQRRIARLLTQAGIPSPSGKRQWSTSTIAHILSNPTYSVTYVALRTQAVEPKVRRLESYGKTSRKRRDEQDQLPLPGLVKEPVVSPEDFARVQVRLARNKAERGKVTQFYLLRGLLRCEVCGRRWRGKILRSGSRIYYRYLCIGTEARDDGMRCACGSLKGPVLEGRVWDRIVSFLSAPEVFLRLLRGRKMTNRRRSSRSRPPSSDWPNVWQNSRMQKPRHIVGMLVPLLRRKPTSAWQLSFGQSDRGSLRNWSVVKRHWRRPSASW